MKPNHILLGFVAALGSIATDAQAQMDVVKPDSLLAHPRNGFVRHSDYNVFRSAGDHNGAFPLCIVSYSYHNKMEKYPVTKHVTTSGVDMNGDNQLSRDEILNIDYNFYDPQRDIGFRVTLNSDTVTYTKSDKRLGGISDKRFTVASYKIDEIRENILNAVFGKPPENETHPDLNPFRM